MSSNTYSQDQIQSNFVILGFGSIGRKHLASINKICPMSKVRVLTSQKIDQRQYGVNVTWHNTIDAVLQTQPDYAVVSTSAALHGKYLDVLAAKSCKILIEKPLAATVEQAERIQSVAKSLKIPPVVAYNIRFSRALGVIRDALSECMIGDVYVVHAVVGQDLAQWRPGRKLAETVSASQKNGGGVLRELSHELDYLSNLFGEIRSASAMLGRQKFINFDVEDTAFMHLQFGKRARKILASVNIDFIRKDPCRYCHIIGSEGTLRWDLLAGRVTRCGTTEADEILYFEPSDMSQTNEIMWRELLDGQCSNFTTIDEAAKYLHWIKMMEADWVSAIE